MGTSGGLQPGDVLPKSLNAQQGTFNESSSGKHNKSSRDKALRKPAIGFSNGSISNPFLRVPILITGGRKRAGGGFDQVCCHHV